MIFAGSERVATLPPGGGVHCYHPDHLGSSSVITDGTGATVQALTYYPYGATRTNSSSSTPAVDVSYKYTGKELDTSTNLYYYGARYYDPTLGRFLSADKLIKTPLDPQSLNRYSYVLGNPIKYNDPTGYSPQISLALYGAGAGAAGGFLGALPQGIIPAFVSGVVGGVSGAAVGFVLAPQLSYQVGTSSGLATATLFAGLSNVLSQIATNIIQGMDLPSAVTSINSAPLIMTMMGVGPITVVLPILLILWKHCL